MNVGAAVMKMEFGRVCSHCAVAREARNVLPVLWADRTPVRLLAGVLTCGRFAARTDRLERDYFGLGQRRRFPRSANQVKRRLARNASWARAGRAVADGLIVAYVSSFESPVLDESDQPTNLIDIVVGVAD